MLIALLGFGQQAFTGTLVATPTNYMQLLRQLGPGDTLQLQPGHYERGMAIHDMHGNAEDPIVIQGPATGRPAVILGRPGRNTVSIKDASHITVRHLEIDGRDAFVDGVKAEGHSMFAHHITLENLYIHSLAPKQQSVGISTKCPAWGWVVRDTRIEGVGTGMYFGDSDGGDPFVGGLIERNEVVNTIGYNLQIKHQVKRPIVEDMPLGSRRTIIRHNRFIKAEGASEGPAARPNVLVGHFPPDGPGKNDEYVIYGNLFFQNPGEALFQGEGNIALYSNLFFNSHDIQFPAIAIQPHNDIPRRVRIFYNTVVHPWKGIRVLRGEDRWVDDQISTGNAVFADVPAEGGRKSGNLERPYRLALDFLEAPIPDLSRLSLRPNEERLLVASPIVQRLQGYPEADRDYAQHRRTWRYYGAYTRTPLATTHQPDG